MRELSIIYFCVILFNIGFTLPTDEDFLNDNQSIYGSLLTLEDYTNLEFDFNDISPDIISDGFLTTPELLKKYGYPVEIHEVTTADGYILEMHRIPKEGATPLFLMHGILDSSGGWVVAGPQSAMAYYLSDMGYDVWMGNARGNRYSKKHTHWSTKSRKFWDFSFHEIGTTDVPSMIDYVIAKTDYKKIHYVAHSQGTTAFFIMCTERPGYCDKIVSMQGLAPVAYLRHVQSPLLRFIAPFTTPLGWITKLFGIKEFLPNNDILSMAGQILCKKESLIQPLCYNILFLITGYNSEQLNKTMVPAILGHIPAGASTKQLLHYGQLVGTNNFRMYDYGWFSNKRQYGQWTPPSYDLSKVSAPVTLYYSMNDWIADPRDVTKLSEKLPNLVSTNLVPLPKFNHLDFLFGIDSRDLVYSKVVTAVKSYETEKSDVETPPQIGFM